MWNDGAEILLYSVYRKLHVNIFISEIRKWKKCDKKRFINLTYTISVKRKVSCATSKRNHDARARKMFAHESRFLLSPNKLVIYVTNPKKNKSIRESKLPRKISVEATTIFEVRYAGEALKRGELYGIIIEMDTRLCCQRRVAYLLAELCLSVILCAYSEGLCRCCASSQLWDHEKISLVLNCIETPNGIFHSTICIRFYKFKASS